MEKQLAAIGIDGLLYLNDGNFCDGVYLCKRGKRKRRAIKIVSTEESYFVECLENEYLALRRTKHPNIVKAKARIHRLDGYAAMEMEFISGHDLCTLLIAASDDRFISYMGLQHVMACLLSAVEYLHQNGIYHNDLKPDNVLVEAKTIENITSDTQIKLCDFGLARIEGVSYKRPRGGSPCWAAPEVFTTQQGNNYQSELWSLGCILFALATQYGPFGFLDRWLRAGGKPPPLPKLYKKIQDELDHYHGCTEGYLNCEEVRDVQNALLQFDPCNRLDIPTVLAMPFFRNKATSDT